MVLDHAVEPTGMVLLGLMLATSIRFGLGAQYVRMTGISTARVSDYSGDEEE